MEAYKCLNYNDCKKVTLHRTGLCLECRKTQCAHPGCDKTFFSYGKNDRCDSHRGKLKQRQENEWSAAI